MGVGSRRSFRSGHHRGHSLYLVQNKTRNLYFARK
nr:MAG TPA: hypothetical protein [Caudoviricetes sp.]